MNVEKYICPMQFEKFEFPRNNGTVGMITLEDLLEEIVGEIQDEYDEDEADQLQEITGEERTYKVNGTMKLSDINDRLGTEFESEDYDSIGGLIIEALDRFPENMETVTLDDETILQVLQVQNNRIEWVKMTLPEPVYENKTSQNKEESNEPAATPDSNNTAED